LKIKPKKKEKPPSYNNMKKYLEYELVILDANEDGKTIAPKKYYFTEESAKEHNEQYAFYDTPRKLVKVKGGEVVEKPEWWSGKIT
tara:strand:+ start:684 stop:941 length:258 start_codon:yes stop_codon:yes gene_type:complete